MPDVPLALVVEEEEQMSPNVPLKQICARYRCKLCSKLVTTIQLIPRNII